MKTRYWILALTLLLLFGLLAGCTAPATIIDTAQAPNEATVTQLPESVTPLASANPSPDPDMISQQLAMDIALLHAGVHADEAEFMQIEFDIDDGRAEFDVQFHVGRTEYEYEIDAKNGSILSHEKDYD